MKNKTYWMTGLALAGTVSLLAGCHLGGGPDIAIGPIVPVAGQATHTYTPAILSDVTRDGMARVYMNVTVSDDPVTRAFHTLSLGSWLPTATGAAVVVSLWSPTANGTYNNFNANRTTLGGGTFSAFGSGFQSSTLAFTALRPAADYQAQAFLQDSVNATGAQQVNSVRLAGAQNTATTTVNPVASTAITLNAGSNTLNFNISPNLLEGTYDVQANSSTHNNNVTGNSIVASDTVTFDTGYSSAMSGTGVAYVNVFLAGTTASPCIAAPAQLAHLTGANISNWLWDTTAAATGYVGVASLNPSVGQVPNIGKVDFLAFDSYNQQIGTAEMNVSIFTPAAVTIQVR